VTATAIFAAVRAVAYPVVCTSLAMCSSARRSAIRRTSQQHTTSANVRNRRNRVIAPRAGRGRFTAALRTLPAADGAGRCYIENGEIAGNNLTIARLFRPRGGTEQLGL
jgi:hypothetical protein